MFSIRRIPEPVRNVCHKEIKETAKKCRQIYGFVGNQIGKEITNKNPNCCGHTKIDTSCWRNKRAGSHFSPGKQGEQTTHWHKKEKINQPDDQNDRKILYYCPLHHNYSNSFCLDIYSKSFSGANYVLNC